MLRRWIAGGCLLMLLAPVSLHGQEARGAQQDTAAQQQAPTLVVSQWKCDWRNVGDIVEGVEQVLVPVWTDLRDEGLLLGAGLFVHEWGDEWNVGMYRLAPDREAFFQAFEEEGPRAEERLGELNLASEENPFSEYCTEHRDNIYTMGPTVGAADQGQ